MNRSRGYQGLVVVWFLEPPAHRAHLARSTHWLAVTQSKTPMWVLVLAADPLLLGCHCMESGSWCTHTLAACISIMTCTVMYPAICLILTSTVYVHLGAANPDDEPKGHR